LSTIQFPVSTAPAAKGGMSHRAFAGRPRLDKLSLSGPSEIGGINFDVCSDVQPERLLWLESFKDACFNYSAWGLGKNGTSKPEFLHAVSYFFYTRSYLPESWRQARFLREVAVDEATGKRVNRVVRLDDNVLMFMCLDAHWPYFDFKMSLDSFTRRLKAERKRLIEQNWRQVAAYLRINRPIIECIDALVCPSDPAELEHVLYGDCTSELTVAA
jgi:hypothetical protein